MFTCGFGLWQLRAYFQSLTSARGWTLTQFNALMQPSSIFANKVKLLQTQAPWRDKNLMLPFLPQSESSQSSVSLCQHEQLQLFFGPKGLYRVPPILSLLWSASLHILAKTMNGRFKHTQKREDPAQCSSLCALPGKPMNVRMCAADPETEASPIRVMISHAWLEHRRIIRSVGADGWLELCGVVESRAAQLTLSSLRIEGSARATTAPVSSCFL